MVASIIQHGGCKVEVMRRVTEIYADKEDITLNMMFHSMEIMPGASPYAAKEEECRRILDNIEQALAHAKDKGFRFSTLGEMPQYFSKPIRSVAKNDKDCRTVPLEAN